MAQSLSSSTNACSRRPVIPLTFLFAVGNRLADVAERPAGGLKMRGS